MFAAQREYIDTVEVLLKRSTNPNLKDNSGLNALFIAQKNNRHHKVVAKLKDTEARRT